MMKGHMIAMKKLMAVVITTMIIALVAIPFPAAGQEPVVEGLLFFSETCPHCQAIITEFLPRMQDKYGQRISIEMVSISDPVAYTVMVELDNLYGVAEDQRGVPELFIGHAVMIGRYSIEENFETVVDEYLAKGGLNMPSFAELRAKIAAALTAAPTTQATAVPTASTTEAAQVVTPSPAIATSTPRPIYSAYFFTVGCQECERAQYDLRFLQQKYPQLQIANYSAADEAVLLEWLGKRYGIPEEQRLTSPAFFIGQDYLLGSNVTLSSLEALVQKYAATGAEKTWEGWETEKAQAEQEMVARYRSFGLFTIVAAGLIDGVNPCAFATLLFLISFLAITGRDRRQIIAVGAAFTIGVFGTYMLLGFGLYQVVSLFTR
ncbi:MAG: hypothetical protein ACUVWR_14520, partial [Anaerolineae bacterium]